MKRILIIAVLALIVVFPVAAASTSWAAGLNVGTGVSLAGQFQMEKFKLNANLGYGFVNKYVAADVFADYQVYEFNINKARFGVTAGVGANLAMVNKAFGLAAIVPVGLVYRLENRDFPLDFYLRVQPGVKILPDLGFHIDAYIGAVWRFQ